MVTAHDQRDLRVVFVAVDVDVGCSELPLTLGAVRAPIRVLDFHFVVGFNKWVSKSLLMLRIHPLRLAMYGVGMCTAVRSQMAEQNPCYLKESNRNQSVLKRLAPLLFVHLR